MSMLGAQCCRPTPATCSVKEACAAEHPGWVTVCLDKCVRPRGLGEPCSPDLCAGDGTCVDGLTCASDLSGKWSCMALGGGLFATGCDLTMGYDTCSNELFCKAKACARELLDNTCVYPQQVNDPCDSNAGDPPSPDNPKCLACEPGTFCEAPDPSAEGEKLCKRFCATTEDCPCGERYRCEDGYCKYCKHRCETACDAYGRPCCDSNTACQARVQGCTGSSCQKQCKPQSCDSSADCCAPEVCISGACTCMQRCVACDDAHPCCSGLACQSGRCGDPFGCKDDADCCGDREYCRDGTCAKCKVACDNCDERHPCCGGLSCESGLCLPPAGGLAACPGTSVLVDDAHVFGPLAVDERDSTEANPVLVTRDNPRLVGWFPGDGPARGPRGSWDTTLHGTHTQYTWYRWNWDPVLGSPGLSRWFQGPSSPVFAYQLELPDKDRSTSTHQFWSHRGAKLAWPNRVYRLGQEYHAASGELSVWPSRLGDRGRLHRMRGPGGNDG